ncbi:MAG TPA: hypothetical protein GXX37_07720 [Clostridiaceae bacterium]|nr:hypothetical protein [Clostridiaceae bacterium]
MQIHSFLAMIFVFVILPLFLLFSNHIIFYITMSLILLIDSIRSIYFSISGKKIITPELDEEDLEFIDNLKTTTGFDLKWFNTCLKIARYLIVILFYIYCSFIANSMIVNILVTIVILYWIHRIIDSYKEEINIKTVLPFNIERIINLIANISSAFVIALVSIIRIKMK